jgi:hypothetical protein
MIYQAGFIAIPVSGMNEGKEERLSPSGTASVFFNME